MPQPIRTEFLFTMPLKVTTITPLGETPYGDRRIARVAGGSFEGPKLRGTIMDGGGDWLLLRRDGVLQLDVRLTMKTDDDALIYMTYRGARHGPADVIKRLNAGEVVDPSQYYFRMSPFFETSAAKYAWLNGIVAVGTGDRKPDGPVYDVHQVL